MEYGLWFKNTIEEQMKIIVLVGKVGLGQRWANRKLFPRLPNVKTKATGVRL